MIGHIPNEQDARTFSDYLYVHGVESQVEAERNGPWAVWVHNEDEVEKARSLLQLFLRDPNAKPFADSVEKARERREEMAREEKAAAKRMFDADDLFAGRLLLGMGRVTAILVIVSVSIWLLSFLPGVKRIMMSFLLISQYYIGNTPAERLIGGLVEIRQGQIWRLVTPILLHFHILHILFNMLWLRDLGTMIELKRGSKLLLLQVLVIGVLSNLGQYVIAGPAFGGMSGVVYGLLGYVWMKGKFDPDSGFFLHPTTVTMMIIWLLFGFTGMMPIANGAHTFGLISGMVWGYLSAQRRS